ncbi:hypothetical protein F511_08863 [Dorcoceras hygrometricum]|uniref:Uncharacterized protein n=1 Tax=Dorcoceras hygrometricum TaxID=472368 RepID=A0A2Z7AME5_9LAMI|nr:hypothetical protein F511_08863 [Dorcoceras hygrometricum]
MASSLFVNTLHVEFTSVLTMEHGGMVRLFKTLEDTGLRGFLEGTTPIFESAVVEFFSNARVIAGTIVSTVFGQNLVVTEEIFSRTFKLPTEGMQNFSGIPNERITEMRTMFSAITVPFQCSGKKKDLHFEYRLLHDIVAKYLCEKAGSFDKVSCENFEVMVAISAGLSVNLSRILFQRLLAMVQNPRKQSQGFTVQISILMELLVRADLGTTNKLHVKKVLTSKQVETILRPTKELLRQRKLQATLRVGRHNKYHQKSQSLLLMPPNKIFPTLRKGNTRLLECAETEDITELSERRSLILYKLLEIELEKLYLAHLANFKPMLSLLILTLIVFVRLSIDNDCKGKETEDITELSERRSLILYKLLEIELEKLYLAHLANFKTNVVSAHLDFDCIRRLHQELQLIAAAHRHHRGLVGLPFTTPECDFLPINPEAIPRAEQDVSPNQDPDFSNLQLIAIAPQESSTLQLLHTATQSLNAISTHVSSLDQSYARLCDDTNITRHHTTKLRDELKSTAEGFDIRIDVLERTLTQRMVDELVVVKYQLAVIVEDLKESCAAKKGEGGSSSRPREGPSGRGLTGGRGGSSSQGVRGKGRSDHPERFRYSKWF